MDEKQFEQEYRAWKKQDAPQLWERIEPRLQDHVRTQEDAGTQKHVRTQEHTRIQKYAGTRKNRYMRYGISAAAAAVVLALVLPGALYSKKTILDGGSGREAKVQETDVLPENTVTQETAAAQETKAMPEAAAAPEAAAVQKTIPGLYSYQQLGLKEGNLLSVPENAVSVPEDAGYFSEELLGDTQLLCSGTVEEVSLDYDEHQRAVKVVYQLTLDAVHYAEDYISSSGRITVQSPIVETEGDEVYLLYQLQPGGRYLLPLKKEGADWELLYPFAPQIQITQDEGYVFHSGYASLMNDETHVVAACQEGANDYFYDRMLLREDEAFLSEFMELMERQIKEKM